MFQVSERVLTCFLTITLLWYCTHVHTHTTHTHDGVWTDGVGEDAHNGGSTWGGGGALGDCTTGISGHVSHRTGVLASYYTQYTPFIHGYTPYKHHMYTFYTWIHTIHTPNRHVSHRPGGIIECNLRSTHVHYWGTCPLSTHGHLLRYVCHYRGNVSKVAYPLVLLRYVRHLA